MRWPGVFVLALTSCSSVVVSGGSDAALDRPVDAQSNADAHTNADATPSATPWACPPGWVSLRGGGCGPAFRACPADVAETTACARVDLTAPSSADRPWAGVEEGRDTPARDWHPPAGIAQCPDGWTRRGDQTCDPMLSTACPVGAAPLPGGRCTATSDADCPPGPWPDLAGLTVRGRVLHVRTDADAGVADGSDGRPYATLDAAIDASRDGDWIALASGSYALRDTPWPAGVSLAGTCAARVTVTVPNVTLRGDLAWRGVTLPGARLTVERDASFALSRSVLRNISGQALRVSGGALRLEDVWVREVRGIPSGAEGVALALDEGAVAHAERLAITGVAGRSVMAIGASAAATSLTITHGAFVESWGDCVEGSQARIELADVAFKRIQGDMISTRYGDHLDLHDVSFENEQATEEAAIQAFAPTLTARRISVRGVQTAIDAQLATSLDVDQMAVEGCGRCLSLSRVGDGVPLATFSRVRIRGLSGFTSMLPAHTRMSFRQSEIGLVDGAISGGAIVLFGGTTLSFDESRLDGVATLPLSDDLSIEVDRSVLGDERGVLRDTLPMFYLVDRQTLRVRHSIVSRRTGSVCAGLSGARVIFEDAIVRDLRSPETQPQAALDVASGSSAALTRVRFIGNAALALSVADADSAASLTDVDVTSLESAATPAFFVARGATLEAARLSIDGASGVAVLVDGADATPRADGTASTRAALTDLYVSRVSPSGDRSTAMTAQRASDVRATRVTISDAAHAFTSSSSRVSLTRAALRGLTGSVGVLRSERDRAGVTLEDVGASAIDPSAVTVDEALPELAPPVRLRAP